MFRIGEFSRIARVSGRLLRYYDGIGLFSPSHTDPVTGYRYYKAGQLAQLNRILALKDLGLSLEQVGRMVDEKISPEEVRGMLMLKRAELEQSLNDGIARLRHIESRLKQIEEQGSLRDFSFQKQCTCQTSPREFDENKTTEKFAKRQKNLPMSKVSSSKPLSFLPRTN